MITASAAKDLADSKIDIQEELRELDSRIYQAAVKGGYSIALNTECMKKPVKSAVLTTLELHGYDIHHVGKEVTISWT